MKTTINLLITIGALWLTSCTNLKIGDIELTQLGGKLKITGDIKTPNGSTINEIEINNEQSLDDAFDFGETIANWWGTMGLAKIWTGANTDQLRSDNDVTKTLDGNRSSEVINASDNALEVEKMKLLVE